MQGNPHFSGYEMKTPEEKLLIFLYEGSVTCRRISSRINISVFSLQQRTLNLKGNTDCK
jgi:hypothetical protein